MTNSRFFVAVPKYEPVGAICSFLNYSWINLDLENIRTCDISDQSLSENRFMIYSALDPSVQGLSVHNTSEVTSIPEHLENIFPALLVLEISDFKIKCIGENELRGLKSLRFLNLDSNEIEWVASNAFRDLKSLEVLKLSHNRIEYLAVTIFDSLVSLQEIDFDGNKIEILNENIFQKLGNLKSVSVSFNHLSELPEKLFQNNSKIESIELVANKIKFIRSMMFDHLKSLNYVDLQENACIDKYYYREAFPLMKTELAKNCEWPDRKPIENDSSSVFPGCKTKVIKVMLLAMALKFI